jgi:hypothetical protein
MGSAYFLFDSSNELFNTHHVWDKMFVTQKAYSINGDDDESVEASISRKVWNPQSLKDVYHSAYFVGENDAENETYRRRCGNLQMAGDTIDHFRIEESYDSAKSITVDDNSGYDSQAQVYDC